MSDMGWIQPALFVLAVVVMPYLPGARPAPSGEPPKKGFWTVGSVFWPIRRTYGALWPVHPELARSIRPTLLLMNALIAAVYFPSRFIRGVDDVLNPLGYVVELAVVALLLGRAFGLWSADRRIRAAAPAAQSPARAEA